MGDKLADPFAGISRVHRDTIAACLYRFASSLPEVVGLSLPEGSAEREEAVGRQWYAREMLGALKCAELAHEARGDAEDAADHAPEEEQANLAAFIEGLSMFQTRADLSAQMAQPAGEPLSFAGAVASVSLLAFGDRSKMTEGAIRGHAQSLGELLGGIAEAVTEDAEAPLLAAAKEKIRKSERGANALQRVAAARRLALEGAIRGVTKTLGNGPRASGLRDAAGAFFGSDFGKDDAAREAEPLVVALADLVLAASPATVAEIRADLAGNVQAIRELFNPGEARDAVGAALLIDAGPERCRRLAEALGFTEAPPEAPAILCTTCRLLIASADETDANGPRCLGHEDPGHD
jgi:hypothetical protein